MKTFLWIILLTMLAYNAEAGVFFYGSGEAVNLENQIGFQNSPAKLKVKDSDYSFYKVDANGNDVELGNSDDELKNFIDDPSFERGVTEWSCTDATVTAETDTNLILAGKQSAKIEVTADDGFCDLTVDFSSLTAEGSGLIVGAQAATKDATMNFNIRKDNEDFSDEGAAVALTESAATVFDFNFFGAFPRAEGVTGIRVSGDNGDIAYIDEAKNELADLRASPSKNCSGDLDCENTFSGLYDASEATLADTVKEQTPEQWITGVSKSSTGNSLKEFAVKDNVFSKVPKCQATIAEGFEGNVIYLPDLSSPISIGFTTTIAASSNGADISFSFDCTKHPDDYKTTQQQGVIVTGGNSAGALLSASNSSETTRTSIATTLTKIDLADVTLEDHIKWDTATSQGDVLIGGTYLMMVYSPVFNNTDSNSQVYTTIEIDTGSGFNEIGEHPCATFTQSSASSSQSLTCPYVLSLNKGDAFRVSAISSGASTVFLTDNSVNGKNISPRLTVVPVPTRAEIAADLKSYIKNGSGKIEKTCRILQNSNSSTPDFSSPDDCIENASRVSSGSYEFDFKSGYFATGTQLYCTMAARRFMQTLRGKASLVNPSEDETIEVFTRTNGNVADDSAWSVKCEGKAP